MLLRIMPQPPVLPPPASRWLPSSLASAYFVHAKRLPEHGIRYCLAFARSYAGSDCVYAAVLVLLSSCGSARVLAAESRPKKADRSHRASHICRASLGG